MFDAVGPFQQAAQRGELVRQFVQRTAQPADHRARHLAGEAQDRRVQPPGGGERRAGVQHARSRHHRIGRRPPRGAGIAERHVGSGLFMPCVDQPQTVGRAGEGIEQAIDLHAGQTEYGVDTVPQQAVDDRFSAGHAWHGNGPQCLGCWRRWHGIGPAPTVMAPLSVSGRLGHGPIVVAGFEFNADNDQVSHLIHRICWCSAAAQGGLEWA